MSITLTLKNQDCLLALADMPDASVSAIITDPPYEISFMSRGWDATGIAYSPVLWSNAYRVLVPGGTVKAFSATRTFHRMGAAMQNAGFTKIDIEAWTYGSGFPKSMNIGKAIDKMSGAEREVVAVVKGMGNQNPEWNGTAQGRAENSFKPEYGLTAPATDAAKVWEGWGTALKPSWEPVLIGKKQ